MDRISSHRISGVNRIHFGGLRIGSLLFVDDSVLLCSSDHDLQLLTGNFAIENEVTKMRISASETRDDGLELDESRMPYCVLETLIQTSS